MTPVTNPRLAALPLIPTTVIGSSPQPAWLVDHDLLVDEGRAAHARRRRVAGARRRARRGARRGDAAGRSTITSRPASTSSPTARSAARATSTTSPTRSTASTASASAKGSTASAGASQVPLVNGPIRRGAPIELDAARVPARRHRPGDEGDRARPVHAQPAGPERALPRPAQPRPGLRRGDQRRAARPGRGRHRRRPARRAVPAGQRRGGPGLRRRGDQPRPRRRRRPRRCCTRATATPCTSATSRGGYPFLAELADCAADQIAVEFAQPRLDPAVLAPLAGKTIVLGVLDLSTADVEPPEVIADRLRAALAVVPRRAARRRAGLRDEVPAARRGERQARRHGRRRGAGPRRAQRCVNVRRRASCSSCPSSPR